MRSSSQSSIVDSSIYDPPIATMPLHLPSFNLNLTYIGDACLDVEGQGCSPSGKIMGKKPPPGQCNQENDSDCCVQGKMYTTYKCSPAVSSQTKATLTINSFQKGGDGGGPSECDSKYHSDDLPVVALSTGWYKGGSRCHNNITISANGQSVVAMVVDECDSTMGCDQDHDYQPPCPNNIVDASKAEIAIYTLLKQIIYTKPSKFKTRIEGEKMKSFSSKTSTILLVCLLFGACLDVEGQGCSPSGKIMGKKPPPGQCNKENDSDCCVQGKMYTIYKCSPAISSQTKATLTINSFEKNGDGGGPSECDGKYHSDDLPVVALSTGWYKGGSRCHNNITISANGRSVVAMVVDECDSTMGCDQDHDYQPPCPNNIVDASKAVWKALGIPQDNWGDLDISWSDA
ncbi:hypothetical protein ACSBR2_016718 [Camellia fascicularis]